LSNNTALRIEFFPRYEEAVGNVSAIFLNEMGKEVPGRYRGVGLSWVGLVKAARRGAVIVMCGGQERNSVALAVLRANLASVLITSSGTAEWLLGQTPLRTAQAGLEVGNV
jgi:DNA-binding transcriptional regulator LsrR (DeoR family)